MNHVRLENGDLMFWLTQPEEIEALEVCIERGGYADHRWFVECQLSIWSMRVLLNDMDVQNGLRHQKPCISGRWYRSRQMPNLQD